MNKNDLKVALGDIVTMENGNVTTDDLLNSGLNYIEEYGYKVTSEELESIVSELIQGVLVEKALIEFVECIENDNIECDSDTLGFILEDLINNNEEYDMSNEEFSELCKATYEECEKRGLFEKLGGNE